MSASIDRLARDSQQKVEVPALSVAVLRRGALLHAAGYGTANPETLYQTASLGKQFTAALAILLAGSGEGPALDAPVAPHLPELPESWGGITLRQLLSHTAGIPGAGYDSLDFARDYTDSEIVRSIAASTLDFAPGTAWSYSNAGYVLAGIALGRSAGAFYGGLLRERIFTPLGMATAAVNAPGAPVGHLRESDHWLRAPFVSVSLNRLADGGVTLSVLDLARWETALCGDWGARVAATFTETTLDNGRPCGYGLGWFLSRSEYGRVAEHDGTWQGFNTAMVRYLDEALSAVVLANADPFDATALAYQLAGAARTDAT